jgi:hypothetical protein
LTTKNPIAGSKKSLAMMILIRANGLMLDDRIPAIICIILGVIIIVKVKHF